MNSRFLKYIKVAWLCLVLLGLAWFFSKYDWRSIFTDRSFGISVIIILLVMVAHIGAILTQGEAISANGPSISLSTNIHIFNHTNISKYIPVSGANLVVYGVMTRNSGHTTKGATASLLLLTYWSVLGASAFGAVAAGLIIGIPPLWSILIALGGATIAFSVRFEKFVGIRGNYRLSRVVLGTLLIWLSYGIAFALALASGNETLKELAIYGSAYDLSFALGLLAIFAPSGVGVREMITALVIENRPTAEIIAATIYLRVLILLTDMIVFAILWAATRKRNIEDTA